jgi:phosphatidylglycerol---prolipoprotein diacylglyceryl transferase
MTLFALLPSRTVAFVLLGFPVHWYGLLYFTAFLIGWFLIGRLQKYRSLHLSSEELSSILTATVIGVIVGGRLGYVLFYNPMYYLQQPLEIFAVWKGGMASHGGFIGVAVALLYVLRQRSMDEVLRIADIVAIPVAIGLGLGRIGNFINQELYGTVTTLPWGMAFPGADGLRHPIQLYDFTLQMIIAGLCFLHLRRSKTSGRTLALFLLLYGVARFLLEFIREQNGVYFWGLTEGQILTIPLLLIALVLWRKTGGRSAGT